MSIIGKKFLNTNLLEKQHFNKHNERERKRKEYITKSITDRKAYLCLSPTEQYILNDKVFLSTYTYVVIASFKIGIKNV